jgi:hypothetical protein
MVLVCIQLAFQPISLDLYDLLLAKSSTPFFVISSTEAPASVTDLFALASALGSLIPDTPGRRRYEVGPRLRQPALQGGDEDIHQARRDFLTEKS